MKKYRCLVCGEEFSTDVEICPICGVGVENFEIFEEEIISNDKKMKVVIIGGGIAGLQTAIEVRKANEQALITIISKEKYLPYNRTLLTKQIDKDYNNIFIKDADFYKENNIDLLLDTEVININTVNKEVTLNNNTKLDYDYLVLSTGSSNNIVDSTPFNKENVFTIRTLEDVKSLKEKLTEPKTITIVGGGVLGLELAQGLKKLNHNVNVLERGNYLMKNAFDLETSTLLKNNLTSKGINIYENSAVTSFNESSLIINDNLELNTDILVFSIGVKPNTNLCKNANINVNKGILVNEYLQTNIENIYSCGDACEYNGRVIGLWNNALDTAKIVANNINGNPTKVDKKLYPMVTKLFSDNYFSVGKITTDYHKIEKDNSYIKYFFENDILVGCVLINREDLQKDLYQKIEAGNTNKVDMI